MKRVLIVEHDNLVRALIAEWLAEAGVRSVYPDAAGVAPANVDAVVVDVASLQEAHAVLSPWQRAYPGTRLVAASGRFAACNTANDAMASRLGVTRVLAKPFARADLYRALGLEEPPSSQQDPNRR